MSTPAWRECAQPRGKGGRFGHKPPGPESDPNELWDPSDDDDDTCQYCGYPIDDCEDSTCEGRLDARAGGTWSTEQGPQALTEDQLRERDRSDQGPLSLPRD